MISSLLCYERGPNNAITLERETNANIRWISSQVLIGAPNFGNTATNVTQEGHHSNRKSFFYLGVHTYIFTYLPLYLLVKYAVPVCKARALMPWRSLFLCNIDSHVSEHHQGSRSDSHSAHAGLVGWWGVQYLSPIVIYL